MSTLSEVSQHIMKLKIQLDTLLLTREGKYFSLTEAGMKLHQQEQDLLKPFDDIEKSIKQDPPLIGIIKITTPGSIGLKLHSYMLDIQKHHPDSEHHVQQLLSKNFSEFEHTNQFEHKGFSNQISLIWEPVSRELGFTVLPLHTVNAFSK
ncbi:MAG: DNA-binding transcriptional LysR family regulator [Colwellia sp.]